MREDDKSIIDRVLQALDQMDEVGGLKEAAAEIGVSHETVGRWRRGDAKRLMPPTRRRLLMWLSRQDPPDSRETREYLASGDAFGEGVAYAVGAMRGFLAGLETSLPPIRPASGADDPGFPNRGRRSLPQTDPPKKRRAGGAGR